MSTSTSSDALQSITTTPATDGSLIDDLARMSRNIATEPWFIGLMVSLALLIIILVNVCILVRERGGKYSVQEKEPFNQNQMLTTNGGGGEGQGFDEYQKTIAEGMINPPVLTGPSNMFFDEKQFHDEDDSMNEYGNGENGKFNEDGSFIGLYGKDRIQTYVVQYNQQNGLNGGQGQQQQGQQQPTNNENIPAASQNNEQQQQQGAAPSKDKNFTTFV
jgi:hypothetical protein